MKTKSGVIFARATAHQHVIRLLKTDPIAVVIAHHTVLNDSAEAAIKKNSGAAATIERNIFSLVPVNSQVLDAGPFQNVTADDRENRRGLRLVGHHAIGVEWLID